MNKIFLSLAVFAGFVSISFAQSSVLGVDNDKNGIRDDVDAIVTSISNTYSLTASQINAVKQIARSQQYILYANPSNRSQASQISLRDASATNCATSRLQPNIFDDVFNKIESATFNTFERQNIYNAYTSLLDDGDTVTPVVVTACEDEFSSAGANQNTSGVYSASSLAGIVPDQNITYPCTVLTQFLEYGSRASQVLTLQKFLSDSGYMEMWATGYFGRNTEAAVKLWQTRHGVDVRGWVGPHTRGSIAAITCHGDAASVQKAVRGVVTTYVPKKVVTSTPKPVIVDTGVIIPETVVTQQPVTTSNKLSNTSGTFYLRRSPVSPLYFTYKVNTVSDLTYICIEAANNSNCSNQDNFVELQSQYRPGVYDAIPNGDRWILNFYYSQASWQNGGKVYLKSTTSPVPDVYTIRVADSL